MAKAFKEMSKKEMRDADRKLSKGIKEFCDICDYSQNYYKAMGETKVIPAIIPLLYNH